VSGFRPPGQIITFYSYKGGTGRSMALANVAWILAANGMRVLVIDWDLEAPGLHRYFRPFLTDPDLGETKGLIDVFWEMAAWQVAHVTPSLEPIDVNASDSDWGAFDPANDTSPPDFARALMSTTRRLKLPAAAQGVNPGGITGVRDDNPFLGAGYIDFIGAGRQGASYSERVNTFDWRGFYELGGANMLIAAASELRTDYHWVLIDSRTGVSDTSGICTMQIPDKVVACFTLNRQSIDGVISVLDSIRVWRASQPRLSAIACYPVAMRIENAEKDRLEAARVHARSLMLDYLPIGTRDERDYWDRMEVTYRPWYAYEEVLAPFGDQTGAGATSDSLLTQMERLTSVITGPVSSYRGQEPLRAPEIPPHERAEVLQLYAFDSQVTVPAQVFDIPDVADQAILRDIYSKEQYWRQQGRRYKQLLSNGELAFLTDLQIANMGQSMQIYVSESRKVRRWLSSMTSISLVTFVPTIALTVGLAMFVIAPMIAVPPPLYPSFVLASAMVGWIISAWLAIILHYLIVGRRWPSPNLSPGEIFALALRGPFQTKIQDFQKKNRD
jgi:MinD-like ATPase involved in chromosome partitioning or flagellar assembly